MRSSLLIFFIATAALLAALAAGAILWQQPASPTDDDDKLRVVATFFPLYDFAREIGQDRIELDILFIQTPEVASFTPADIQKINRADLLVKNGVGLEPVLDDLIRSSDNPNLTVVDTSANVPLTDTPEPIHVDDEDDHHDDHDNHHEEESGHRHDHAGPDPHIWLDPQRAIIQVGNIRDALITADPANADFYRQNAEVYINQLRELDQEIATQAATFTKRDFVAFHSAFIYFAQRYNLNQAAVIEEFPGVDPTPRYLTEVINTIRHLNITVIFSEPQFSPRVVESIARDLNLTVHELDPIETGHPDQDSYISLMRQNLATLETALR